MSINKAQLIDLVEDTLIEMALYSDEAKDLVLGTIAQESHFGTYIKQIKGPAKGIAQIEPYTHDDMWENFIRYKEDIQAYLFSITSARSRKTYEGHQLPDASELVWNLKYSIAMCRVFYLRRPEPIPKDLVGQAEYYKLHYNTNRGKATVEEYIKNYRRFVLE